MRRENKGQEKQGVRQREHDRRETRNGASREDCENYGLLSITVTRVIRVVRVIKLANVADRHRKCSRIAS